MGRDSVKFGGESAGSAATRRTPASMPATFLSTSLHRRQTRYRLPRRRANALASFLLGTAAKRLHPGGEPAARQEKLLLAFLSERHTPFTGQTQGQPGCTVDYLGPLTDRFNELPRGSPSHEKPISPASFPVYGGVFLPELAAIRVESSTRPSALRPRLGVAYQLDSHKRAACGLRPGLRPDFKRSRQRAWVHADHNMVTSIQAGVTGEHPGQSIPNRYFAARRIVAGTTDRVGQSYQFADPIRRSAAPGTSVFVRNSA